MFAILSWCTFGVFVSCLVRFLCVFLFSFCLHTEICLKFNFLYHWCYLFLTQNLIKHTAKLLQFTYFKFSGGFFLHFKFLKLNEVWGKILVPVHVSYIFCEYELVRSAFCIQCFLFVFVLVCVPTV